MQFATGAMSSLIPKLGGLLLEEYNLKSSVKKGIGDLKAELESMQAALVKVSSVPLDQLDPQVMIWANEVRELSYAIEDSLDSFLTRVEGVEPTKLKIKHLFKKARNKFTKFKVRHEIASDIKDIESQVRKIKERFDRYKFKDVVANLPTTTVDPRLSALYNKVSDLVGIAKPMDELVKVLLEGVDMSKKNPKIISIVGFGGLVKTTLAKALYDKLNKTYQCQGFVPVGQNPDTKKVLRDILLELDMELYRDAATMDERQLIYQLQKFLAGKRYFLVIDDIWDIPTWETIKFAFVDSHPESRISITTRSVDVATNSGGIYRMEPLSDENSKVLFHTRTYGEGLSKDNQPAEVTNKILKKCGGVPLAIITIASLLVGKRTEDWSKVYDAIGFGHEDNDDVHNTRKVLSFSYYDLPSHLKTCLLYLSMFPEDSFIVKKTLIWRWVSEGFVLDREGIGSYELGEIYFNQLVNKSMIRLEEDNEDELGPVGCRVHDMVLDLIRTISNDVNFVTVHDIGKHSACLKGKRTNRVRRLAVHRGSDEHKSSIEKEHVRSFNAIMCSDSRMSLLSNFKVLRVLVIEDCVFPEGRSIEHIGQLVHLRYLGVVYTSVELPKGIGHDLKFLEILDVRGGYISELPPSVGEQWSLRCLLASAGTIMKGEIGKLTSLEELQLSSVDKCPNFFTDLGKLTNLRVLEIYFGRMKETMGKALAESICNLRNIYSLKVKPNDDEEIVLGGSLEELVPSSNIYSFGPIFIVIPRVPSWINCLCVPLLYRLELRVQVIEARDVQTLGRLPSLHFLCLWSDVKNCISYSFGSNEFHKLIDLWTNIGISIGEGALLMLKELGYPATASTPIKDGASLVPWNNKCPLLENITCWLDCPNMGNAEVAAVGAALEDATQTHPNKPELYMEVENHSWEEGELIDNLELILPSLASIRSEKVYLTADAQEKVRGMVTSLETFLRHAAEPILLGRYGEQEIRGFVATFKSLLHDDAGEGTSQGEAGRLLSDLLESLEFSTTWET